MAFNLTATATDLLARLGVVSFDDLDWCSEAEVYAYFDEAQKLLASKTGMFTERDATGTLATGSNQYQAPTGWISTIHLSIAGQRIRPASATELEALDSGYAATLGTPKRYSDDAGPLGSITYYPIPQSGDAGKSVAVVFHESPPAITDAATTIPAASPVSDYFLYFALGRARGKESVHAMPEIAAHAQQRCALFEQIFQQYWGEE